jgi:hypothetical protein
MKQMRPHVEKAVFGFGMLNPVLAVPQILTIWQTGKVAGLSSVTVSSGLLMAALMTLYGLLERSRALWVPSAIWVTIHTSILAGILKFG